MDDGKKGYRGGLYGDAEDDFTPHLSEPTHDSTSETFRDPLFEDNELPKNEVMGGKLALTSVILGVISLLTSACGVAALIPAVLAIVLGIVAKVQLKDSYDKAPKNLATAGIVLGIMGCCVIGLLYFMGWVIGTGQQSFYEKIHGIESSIVG